MLRELMMAGAMVAAAPEHRAAPPPDAKNVLPAFTMTGPGGASGTVDLARDANSARIDAAFDLVHQGKPGEAVLILDGVIAAEEQAHRDAKTLYFSARSTTEAIFYSALAMVTHKPTIVTNDVWADAYFLKGYALVDLQRSDEAGPLFKRALELAPKNAQIQAELAEWHKSRREWPAAFDAYEEAAANAEFSPDDARSFEKGRALRGMAFVKVEQGDLDAAEKYLKEALKLNPADERARTDLVDVGQRRLLVKR